MDIKRNEPEVIEHFFLTDKNTAWAGPDNYDVEYEVLQNDLDSEGVRIIKLKKVDPKERAKKLKSLVDVIAERLGEGNSKAFKGILKDAMGDYWTETLDRLYGKIVTEGEKVTARPGCFEVTVGDRRKRSAESIALRE